MPGQYNRQLFFDNVRNAPFSGLATTQVAGMEGLLTYAEKQMEWLPTEPGNQYLLYWTAYLLATTFHETARTMLPITEYGSQSYLNSRRYAPFYGRGFVQLTWDTNYRRSDLEINRDRLVSDETFAEFGGTIDQLGTPPQALHAEIAACNLFVGCWRGWYGHRLTQHITNDKRDYTNARRCVNVMDKASTIANYSVKFEQALLNSWQNDPVEIPEPELPPPMPEPPDPSLPPPVEPPPDGHEYWENWPDEVVQIFRDTSANEVRIAQRIGERDAELIFMNPWIP